MEKFDTIVIGGGPAGLMAAIQASGKGERVLVVEKNDSLGVKLLLAGRGRCNFSNAEPDMNAFLERYGKNGRFLHSAFSKFGPKETLEFFQNNGVETVTERGGRIFPADTTSNTSGVGAGKTGGQRILDTLLLLCKKNGVRILRNSPVTHIKIRGKRIARIITNQEELEADRYIVATGGKSWPKTGSTGDGYHFAQQAGHTIVTPVPSLVPIRTKERWVKLARGFNLRNVRLTVFVDGKKVDERFGEMEFTNFGLSGPIVMDLSASIPDWMGRVAYSGDNNSINASSGHTVELSLDLKPALDQAALRERIKRDFSRSSDKGDKIGNRPGKSFAYAMRGLVPGKLLPLVLELSDIPSDKLVAYISPEEIDATAELLKNIRMTVNGLWGFNSAVVTRGGVSLNEVDPATMKSRLCENLYFAGEILDLNGPSGGFNLQVCWTTGYIAGLGDAANASK